MVEAAPSRVLRKAGEAAISAFWTVVAAAPNGGMAFAIVLEASIVVATKLRKAVFHL